MFGGPDLTSVGQPYHWTWQTPGYQQQCEHCYCQPSSFIGSKDHPVEHVTCCHCLHTLAKEFVPENQKTHIEVNSDD